MKKVEFLGAVFFALLDGSTTRWRWIKFFVLNVALVATPQKLVLECLKTGVLNVNMDATAMMS
jgi:hypothetical protein